MPKVRSIECSFVDIQKHLSVARSRITKLSNNSNNIKQRTNLLAKIDESMRLAVDMEQEATTLVENENLSATSSNRSISNELERIKKELEKDIPKIDYHSVVPAMCNCTDLREAYKIARKHNMPPEEIDQIIRDAPPNTNLAKAHAALKAKQKPVAAVVEPNGFEQQQEEEDTIDSDIDDELRKVLEG